MLELIKDPALLDFFFVIIGFLGFAWGFSIMRSDDPYDFIGISPPQSEDDESLNS